MSSALLRIRRRIRGKWSKTILVMSSKETSSIRKLENLKRSFKWVERIPKNCPQTTRSLCKRRTSWCNSWRCSRRIHLRFRREWSEVSRPRKRYRTKAIKLRHSRTRSVTLNGNSSRRTQRQSSSRMKYSACNKNLRLCKVIMPHWRKI